MSRYLYKLDCICCKECKVAKCDGTCIKEGTSSNLLEKNDIVKKNRKLFKMDRTATRRIRHAIDVAITDYFYVWITGDGMNSIEISDKITYCAIGRYHEKSGMHVVVYNLHFGEFCQAIRDSWSNGGYLPGGHDMKEYYISNARLLIISGTDYMTFREMESQKLLNIIDSRQRKGLATILCTPDIDRVSKGGDNTFQAIVSPKYKAWQIRQEQVIEELRKRRRENE